MKRRRVLIALGVVSALGVGVIATTNALVLRAAEHRVFETPAEVPYRPVAIVPGARVYASGNPSPVLEDRLATALELYRRGAVRRILVTGDNGAATYDEVTVMKRWLVARGVPDEHVVRDHAGFRTLDSMVRAVKVFQVERAVVCTQRFHLARSMFLARRYGLDAVGAEADRRPYPKALRDALREVAARAVAVSDVFITRRRPRFLGEQIPLE
jgi:SanA protein